MGVGPGSPKGGGRKKGALNRKTMILEELCRKKKICPWEALLELCKHEDPAIKLGAVKEACQYLYPKRRAIELSEDPNAPLGASSEAAELAALRKEVETFRNERK